MQQELKKSAGNQITYPTVVMVTTAHQNPSQAPWTNVVENSDEKKTYSYEETNQLKTDYQAFNLVRWHSKVFSRLF